MFRVCVGITSMSGLIVSLLVSVLHALSGLTFGFFCILITCMSGPNITVCIGIKCIAGLTF